MTEDLRCTFLEAANDGDTEEGAGHRSRRHDDGCADVMLSILIGALSYRLAALTGCTSALPNRRTMQGSAVFNLVRQRGSSLKRETLEDSGFS